MTEAEIREMLIRYKKKTGLSNYEIALNIGISYTPVDRLITGHNVSKRSLSDIEKFLKREYSLEGNSALYEIKQFEIYVPDLEDTKRWCQDFCYQNGITFHEDEPILDNLTLMLQCGFGIQIGFQPQDTTQKLTGE